MSTDSPTERDCTVARHADEFRLDYAEHVGLTLRVGLYVPEDTMLVPSDRQVAQINAAAERLVGRDDAWDVRVEGNTAVLSFDSHPPL